MDESAGSPRPEPDPTRRLLKIFGVKVTDYEQRSRELVQRAGAAGSPVEREAILRELAELTADLHHWLQEITSRVLQLQSDALLGLVSKGPGEPGPSS